MPNTSLARKHGVGSGSHAAGGGGDQSDGGLAQKAQQRSKIARVSDDTDRKTKRLKDVEISIPIVYGTISFWLGKKATEYNSHKWTVYVRGATNEDLSAVVKRAVFQLHPSFDNPTRIVESAPFELSESGWGEFEIAITLFFHNDVCDKQLDLYHQLKLYPEEESGPQSTKRPVVVETYDEIVLSDPSEAFFTRIQNHPVAIAPRLPASINLPHPGPIENSSEKKRGDTKDHLFNQWFMNFSEADELLKLAAARQQAILSMKAVASITSWTMQVEKDLWLSSSFAFLWNFSWKVILFPTNASEAGAETHLAAYEALVSVLKALSTAFSPLALEFVRVFNRSTFPNGQEKPLLDPFLLNFLQNINNLLDEGILTRSRRSVLMNWKWLCLDSLLSIPYNVIETGAQPNIACTFFSDSTIRISLSDIVESLENAGETSMLPLLRSLRSIIGLLCLGRMCSTVSLCNGIDIKMMMQLVQSSWILHLSCNKRRIAPIAALFSSVLHPSVFSDVRMHEMSCDDEGPLKWFIQKILEEGTKSPRTIRLAALHLTGLWLSCPTTIKYYIEELMLLSLYGSVAFDEDFEAELSENQEAAVEVSTLSKCPDAELAEVFINTEMYARVAVAVLFDKLADLANANKDQKDNADAQSALLAGKMFLLELLDSAVTDKDLAKELYKKYSGVHRRKVRAWQMICVLSRFVDQDIIKQVSSMMHVCLYRNNLPAVRQYLEIFAIQIYLNFPSLVEEELLPIFHDYNVRPQALSSYVFVAANVILHASEVPLQLKHLNVLLPPIIPLLTSHHHSLRGFTQLLVYHVLCKLVPMLEPNNLEVVPLEKKCFEELKSYLAGNVDCARLRASMEGFLSSFDPRSAARPAGIFNARNEGTDFECVPLTLMEQVITFLNDVREDLRYSMAKDDMTIKNESFAVTSDHKKLEKSLDCNGDSLRMLGDTLLDFQKKITLDELQSQPLDTGVARFSCQEDFSRFLSEMEKEDQLFSSALQSRNIAMDRLRGSRQQFILVASLLDRIPNLAGLARTCEVFRAAGLAIADANILHDKQFQLISVTADKWVPIMEVPVCSMKAFLEKKKCEGFSILGLEQTANSTLLDQYSFPKKTVLVLGREKEGIPVDIIHCLDACLEIPQLGVVRSLNVHVSGAIALWEYTRQQRLKGL